ncbi:MAG TPA: arylesterase [Bryobacteraceae bacterium]|nr:arylesterase [Bryobacteraceae bacterium]
MRYSLFLAPALALAVALASSGCSGSHETSREPARDSSRELSPEPPDDGRPMPPPAPAAANDHRKVIAVFGDSVAAGFGLAAGQSFPDDLQKRLDAAGYPYRVVNLGISGDTTEGGVSRIGSATSLKPSIVVLELGGNDGLRGMPLASTRANLDQMIRAFQDAGAKVVLAGMTLPPNYGPDYIQGFEKIYKDLAGKYKLPFIPFLMSDIVTKDLRYIQADGIHPTAAGAEIVSGTVLRAIEPLLKKDERVAR